MRSHTEIHQESDASLRQSPGFDPSVVSHVILADTAHCKGGADIEGNVCATRGPVGKT